MYKVIIIDDEKAAIETLRRDLEVQADLEIKGTAGNGAKGKKLIMDIHPVLLFLDIELPDIQGIRLLSEVRLLLKTTEMNSVKQLNNSLDS
jgi:two-component system, LytTR family, response regulator